MTDFVKQIVVKHIGLQVLPEHYPIVGTCLIQTMVELLPPEIANKDFLEAWTIAYGNLAKLLIDLEAAEYAKQPWRWFKDFKVTRIVQECKDVKSVYFTPVDKDLYHYQNLNVVNTCVSDGNYLVKNLRFLVNIQCQNSLKKMNIEFLLDMSQVVRSQVIFITI